MEVQIRNAQRFLEHSPIDKSGTDRNWKLKRAMSVGVVRVTGATVLVAGRPGLGFWLLEDASAAKWRLYNLAKEHNAACGDGLCGVNST